MFTRNLKKVVRYLIGDPTTLLEEMPDAPALFHYYRTLMKTGHRRVPGGWVYDNAFYPDHLTVGGASFGAIRIAKQYCHGNGLDIGAAHWPFPGATAIDPVLGANSTSLDAIPECSQDYVFSSHTLEHIADWKAALLLWVSKLRLGGTLFIYLPHPECGLWRMDNPFMAKHHLWTPTPQKIKEAMSDIGCQVVAFDDGPDIMQSFYVCATVARSVDGR